MTSGPNLALNLALGGDARECLRLDFLPLTDEGEPVLQGELASLCCELSRPGLLAYVEAEIFGGDGTQAHCMFEYGRAAGAPFIGAGAINQALRQIGVIAPAGRDEFDCTGLGKHRDTDGWLEKL
jgi:hypothetical protein